MEHEVCMGQQARHSRRESTYRWCRLKFSIDGLILLSISMDNTFKVLDLQQMRNPIKIFDNIPNYYAQTNAGFSPDEKLILNGTSVEKEDIIGGTLCFYDRRKLELVSRMGISPHQSVVRCSLYPKIKCL